MTTTTARDPRLPFTQLEESFLAPRDPVLGYVKIGGKGEKVRFAQSGKPWVAPTRFTDPPRFEVTTREKRIQEVEGQGKAKGQKFTVDRGYVRDEAFHEKVGKEPNLLRIRLLYPTWHQNLIAFLGAHNGTKWICRGNGVQAVDLARGECMCPCPRLKQFEGTYGGAKPGDSIPCKPHGQLNMLLEDAEVFGGFWAFKTTSYESISNLTKSMQLFEQMFGRIDGLPLELRVMAATKSYGDGKTTQPIVTLVLPASMSTARQVAADAAAESRKFLPAGRVLDYDTYRSAVISEMESETEAYAGEFVPEVTDPDQPPAAAAPAKPAQAPPAPPAPQVATATAATPASDDGPDHEIVEDGEDDGDQEEATGAPEAAPPAVAEPTPAAESTPPVQASAQAPESPPAESEMDRLEKICRAILEAAGWKPQPIVDRLDHHRKQGLASMQRLLDGLKVHMPKEYARVNQGGLFDAPPQDGLPV